MSVQDFTHDINSEILAGWSTNPPYFTGIRISGLEVFSPLEGKVVFIGQNSEGYTITVWSNVNECVRYCNLSSCEVTLNQSISSSTKIGNCNKSFRFEYCTSYANGSNWPVRIGTNTYYKQDPARLVSGEYEPYTHKEATIHSAIDSKQIALNKYQKGEFAHVRRVVDVE